jgi:hypothetical protein
VPALQSLITPPFPLRFIPFLPDLYSPCINLLLAVLTLLSCHATPLLFDPLLSNTKRNAPRLPDLIVPRRDLPNPTMTRPFSPCLLCLNTSDLADLTLPQLSVPALPIRTSPVPNSSRHSLQAMPAVPALDNPQRNAPLHSCLDPSQLTVPIRCLPQLPLLSCLHAPQHSATFHSPTHLASPASTLHVVPIRSPTVPSSPAIPSHLSN